MIKLQGTLPSKAWETRAAARIRPEDLQDGIVYLDEIIERDPEKKLKLLGVRMMDPRKFIGDESHLGNEDPGWLKKYPESSWGRRLKEEFGRPFTHILSLWKKDEVPPGIMIDGMMADGRGRAIFFYAIGEKMPVAQYR